MDQDWSDSKLPWLDIVLVYIDIDIDIECLIGSQLFGQASADRCNLEYAIAMDTTTKHFDEDEDYYPRFYIDNQDDEDEQIDQDE